TQTDANGEYLFSNVVPGSYYLLVNAQGAQPYVQKVELASQRRLIANARLSQPKLFISSDAPKVPVLLVPGIMGSSIP
ncbi:carboxypeptidase-like regulatory domain-containing protein, partial [Acinetobacter baumannii]